MKKVGFIGLGNMGGHICHKIIEGGYDVACFDMDKERLQKFHRKAHLSDSPTDVFKASGITFLSLPSSVQVEAVTAEFLKMNADNKTVIDLSTSFPFSTMEIYKKFKAKGWEYGDASIVGTPKQAAEGTLLLFFGGDKGTYQHNLDLMEQFSKKVHYMGESGSGNIAKLVNNYLAIMYDVLYAEIFPFAEKAGMDVQKLYEVIGESGVDCMLYRNAGKQVVDKNFQLSFSLDLALKDLNYLKKMHNDMDAPSLVLDGGINLLSLGQKKGLGQGDITGIAQVVSDFYEKS